MLMTTVPEELGVLLADVFDVEPEEIKPELAMDSIPGWDSFAHVQAILSMEMELGAKFDPRVIPKLTTVEKILEELGNQGIELN